MPKLSVAGLAWIAPALMLFAAFGVNGRLQFRLGYLAGVAYYLASLCWLLLIPSVGFPILGWAALSAFIALYPATWVWLSWKIYPVKCTAENNAPSPANWSEQFLSAPWVQRMAWAISCAALWVALEMLVSRFLGGFPWNLLGTSQYRIVPLIQIASFTGVYGVSFIVVWTSVSLFSATMVIIRRPANRSAWAGEIFLPALAVGAIYVTGYQKLIRPERSNPSVSVALIQPSIPQTLIWNPKENATRFKQLLQLSESALTNKPDLLIWPEAALPKMLRYDDETLNAVTTLARTHKVWMIVGSDDSEPSHTSKNSNDTDDFNSSFLVSPDGELAQRYIKRNLVIFGEYIPFIKWLPFIKYLTPIDGGFTPGEKVVPFGLRNLNVNLSVLICFEDVFPHLVREYVFDDTDFLVNITNDGWFGEGSAQWQQAAGAIFRAVENGVPLVRCSNNGLTCWIDSHGRLQQIFESKSEGIYGPGYLITHIPVLLPGEKRTPTYYREHGDVFGWVCVALAISQLLRVKTKNSVRAPGAPVSAPAS